MRGWYFPVKCCSRIFLGNGGENPKKYCRKNVRISKNAVVIIRQIVYYIIDEMFLKSNSSLTGGVWLGSGIFAFAEPSGSAACTTI
jgi:hypothetical protein